LFSVVLHAVAHLGFKRYLEKIEHFLSLLCEAPAMSPRIRVKGATIVSMDPTIGIIESSDLLIDGGKIIAVGKNVGSWAVIEIDGRGMIAMPGFINGHIHLWQTALRGVAADWTLDHYFSVLIGKVVGLYTPQDAYIGNLVGALDQRHQARPQRHGPPYRSDPRRLRHRRANR
jgi:hypothetical protein